MTSKIHAPAPGRGPLQSIRVVEIGGLPAASYAARLFADFGAQVIRVEPPGGDPSRQRAPIIRDGQDNPISGWFAFLNHGKQSVCVDSSSADGRARLSHQLADADVVFDSLTDAQRAQAGIDHAALRAPRAGGAAARAVDVAPHAEGIPSPDSGGSARAAETPGPVIVDVSWFGRDGPYAGYAATDAVCRALAGLVQLIGPIEGPPLTLPDYQVAITGGLSAFIPALASLLVRAPANQPSELWQLSLHEAAVALTEFQATEAWQTRTPQGRRGFNRFTPTYPMGIYQCREGWLGITILTPAQWASFCEMLGLPTEMISDPEYGSGAARLLHAEALEAMMMPRFLERTAQDWFDQGLQLRLPLAIVPDMAALLKTKVFRDRRMFVPIDVGGREVEGPGSPMNLSACPPRLGGHVPALDEHDARLFASRRSRPRAVTANPFLKPREAGQAHNVDQPLAGLTIVDLSMGWAGPLCARNMADLGADVIKVEACGYADWWRGVSNKPEDFEQRVYEQQARFNMMNRNKRAITLDLTSAEGVRLLKLMVRDADAVIENYSSSVLRKLGLDYPALREVNPSLVMVSMAAFGAGNEWSECRAYGSTLEQGSGLPSAGGRDTDPPMMNHIAYGDAVGGLNGSGALLLGLLHRQQTGQGQHIDLSQIECMLPYVAPWVVEQSANGQVAPRLGNRHPDFAPQGIYRCLGDDQWVLISVTSDAMWSSMVNVIGDKRLSQDKSLAGVAGRRAAADAIDSIVNEWTGLLTPDEAMNRLQQAGVAAGVVRAPIDVIEDPHLQARGFWQPITRAYVGEHPQPLPPYRAENRVLPVTRPAPTLGEHNREILVGRLGLDDAALIKLAADDVIGTQARIPASARPRKFGPAAVAEQK